LSESLSKSDQQFKEIRKQKDIKEIKENEHQSITVSEKDKLLQQQIEKEKDTNKQPKENEREKEKQQQEEKKQEQEKQLLFESNEKIKEIEIKEKKN